MGTPAGRQVIAAGLMMAATAITAKDMRGATPPPAPPEPPKPPRPPESSADASPEAPGASTAGSGPFAGETPEPPRSDAAALPPEFAKVIDSFASLDPPPQGGGFWAQRGVAGVAGGTGTSS